MDTSLISIGSANHCKSLRNVKVKRTAKGTRFARVPLAEEFSIFQADGLSLGGNFHRAGFEFGRSRDRVILVDR